MRHASVGPLPVQKKEALSDTKLPEEFRVAIAKSLVDDLFSKVPTGAAAAPRAKRFRVSMRT